MHWFNYKCANMANGAHNNKVLKLIIKRLRKRAEEYEHIYNRTSHEDKDLRAEYRATITALKETADCIEEAIEATNGD
jgi:hypothetical protein